MTDDVSVAPLLPPGTAVTKPKMTPSCHARGMYSLNCTATTLHNTCRPPRTASPAVPVK